MIGETERGERDILTQGHDRAKAGRCQSVQPMLKTTSSSKKKKEKKRVGRMTEIKRGFLCLSLSASLPPFSLPLKFWADTKP